MNDKIEIRKEIKKTNERIERAETLLKKTEAKLKEIKTLLINKGILEKKQKKQKIDETLKAFAEEGKKNKNNVDKMYVEGKSPYDLNFND